MLQATGFQLAKRQLAFALLISLGLCGVAQAAERVIDFEGASRLPSPLTGFATPQGFHVLNGPDAFIMCAAIPEGFCPDFNTEAWASRPLMMLGAGNTPQADLVHAQSLAFDLLELDVWLAPTSQYSGPEALITGFDQNGNLVAQQAVNNSGGIGWRTVVFDASWQGVYKVRLRPQAGDYESYLGYFDNIKVAVPVLIDFAGINQSKVSKAFDVPQGFTVTADAQGGYFGSLLLAAAPEDNLAIFGSNAIAHIDRSDERLFDLLQLDVFLSPPVTHPNPPAAETLFRAYDKDGNLLVEKAVNIANNLGWTTVEFDNSWADIDTLTIVGQDLYDRREIAIDNIKAEVGPLQVKIDVLPYSAVNTIDPASSAPVQVGIISTSTANGEAVDFDATQVNGPSLRFGTGQAPLAVTPWPTPWPVDIEGDGDMDVMVAFTSPAAAISCEDAELTVTGKTTAGDDFMATDAIVTPDCPTASCHP